MGAELVELQETALKLVGIWPKILFTLIYFGGTILLIVLGIRSQLKRYKSRRSENIAFGDAAARVTGTEISADRKFTMVEDGLDIREGGKNYTRKYYYKVTYEYFIDNVRYTTTHKLDKYRKEDQQHIFYYDPAIPNKVYWDPHDYKPVQKGQGCGCLVYVVLWVLLNILIVKIIK